MASPRLATQVTPRLLAFARAQAKRYGVSTAAYLRHLLLSDAVRAGKDPDTLLSKRPARGTRHDPLQLDLFA